MCDTLSFELSAVVKWLNLNFLSLHFSKTKFVVFKNKHISDTLNIIYEDKLILKSESALFLGLEVENKLTFGNHISRLCRNFCKIQSVLFKLQFLPSHILLKLDYARVYPNLIYSINAWGSVSSSLLNKLFASQKKKKIMLWI